MVNAHARTQNGIEPDLFPLEWRSESELGSESESLLIVVASFLPSILPYPLQTDTFCCLPSSAAGKGSARIVDVNWPSQANEQREDSALAEATKMKPK